MDDVDQSLGPSGAVVSVVGAGVTHYIRRRLVGT